MGLVAEFRSKLKESTLTSALDGRSFVRSSLVAEWLTSHSATPTIHDTTPMRRMDDIYSALHPGRKSLPSSLVQNAGVQVKLFCILFTIGCLETLDVFWSYTLLDRDLPLSLEKLQVVANTDSCKYFESFANKFYRAQWPFCPATFDLFQAKTLESEHVLPLSRMKMIGAGGTARVYQIAVPEEFLGPHFVDRLSFARFKDTEGAVGPSVQLVMKTYQKNMADIGHNEVRVYRLLKSNQNFVQYLCDFSHDGKLSILLEQGELDLNEYFSCQSPPVLQKNVTGFWCALSSVVKSIEDIHEMSIEISRGQGESSFVEYSGSVLYSL